jgi:hypothetical protein
MQEARVLERLRLEVGDIIKEYQDQLDYFRRKYERHYHKYGVHISDEELVSHYGIIIYREALRKVEYLLSCYNK